MSKDNLRIWNLGKEVPTTACKTITGGRLKGFTDIKPQWRYEKLTELFGPCGLGWYTETKRLWIEEGAKGEKTANAEVLLFYKDGDIWSKPVNGVGGSSFIENQSKGPYTNDECFKMAETDAISVCCKVLGIGADIYNGLPATKYPTIPENKVQTKSPGPKPDTAKLIEALLKIAISKGYTEKDVFKKFPEGIDKYGLDQINKVIDHYTKGETKGIRCRNALIKKSGKSVIEINKVSQAKFELNFTSLTEDQMEAVKEAL